MKKVLFGAGCFAAGFLLSTLGHILNEDIDSGPEGDDEALLPPARHLWLDEPDDDEPRMRVLP